jgi:hypothetical protein
MLFCCTDTNRSLRVSSGRVLAVLSISSLQSVHSSCISVGGASVVGTDADLFDAPSKHTKSDGGKSAFSSGSMKLVANICSALAGAFLFASSSPSKFFTSLYASVSRPSYLVKMAMTGTEYRQSGRLTKRLQCLPLPLISVLKKSISVPSNGRVVSVGRQHLLKADEL